MHSTPSRVRHIRWGPPDYQESVQTVPADTSSADWVSFDIRDCPQRCFVWLSWSVMLRHHYGFGEPWYEPDLPWRIDVVSAEHVGDTLVIRDMFVDVSASEDGTRYKMMDLDELAEAVARGKISQEDSLTAVRVLQDWLDMLHGFRVARDFPPRSLPSSA